MTEETLFAEALARPVPSEREAFLDEACKGDPELRARVEELLRSHEQETGFLREPAVLQIAPDPAGREGQGADRRPAEAATQVITADGPAPPISPDLVATIAPEDTGEAPFRNGHPAPGPRPIAEGPGSRIGPYKLLQRDRRGGHGRRLHGRAGAAGPSQGGAQDHQAGDGFRAGRRPVRGRAPGPGDDGPPQHRPGVRRRHHRDRPPVLRHGAGQRHPDHRVLRRGPAVDPGAAGAVRGRLPGDPARRTRRGSSTATSSPRTCW